MKGRNKGSLPLLVMQVLPEGEGHGYRIAKRIREGSEGVLDFREGTRYPTLHMLEGEGFLRARRAIVNGRARRYYELTPAGREALKAERERWDRYREAVEVVLSGA